MAYVLDEWADYPSHHGNPPKNIMFHVHLTSDSSGMMTIHKYGKHWKTTLFFDRDTYWVPKVCLSSILFDLDVTINIQQPFKPCRWGRRLRVQCLWKHFEGRFSKWNGKVKVNDTGRIRQNMAAICTDIQWRLIDLLSLNLVGGLNPSEKILINWDDYSQYMGK